MEEWKNGRLEKWGDSTIRECDNSTIRQWKNGRSEKWGDSTIRQCDNWIIRQWRNGGMEEWKKKILESWNHGKMSNIQCKM